MKDEAFRQQLGEELHRDVQVIADVLPHPKEGEVWTALVFDEEGQVCLLKVKIVYVDKLSLAYLPGFYVRVVHCLNDRGLPVALPLANLREQVS